MTNTILPDSILDAHVRRPGDVIRGDAGVNILEGTMGDDRILGLSGNDLMNGHEGDDILEGGNGEDMLTGNEGADRFVIDHHDGNDIISDFVPTNSPCPEGVFCVHGGFPEDRIVLWGEKPGDVQAILDSVTVSSRGEAVITYGETTVTFVGIPPEDVSGLWFDLT